MGKANASWKNHLRDDRTLDVGELGKGTLTSRPLLPEVNENLKKRSK
jgi:hypothetical protein